MMARMAVELPVVKGILTVKANLKSWVRYRTVDGVENAWNSGDLLGNLCFCAY